MIDTLQRRLRAETPCKMLFDAATSGQRATDAPSSQEMPLDVLVPGTPEDLPTAIAIAASDAIRQPQFLS
jgi:hypothetical protein